MHENLQVRVSEINQLPYALVPRGAMWSLVEFLAFQRIRVTYSYFPSYFTVTFLNMSVEAAQQVLDDWGRMEEKASANSEHHVAGRG